MKELIKITEDNGRQVVSARELYAFLGSKSQFNHWIKRMLEYGFVEGQDFTSFLTKSNRGRPSKDFALTIDCAKEVAMVQRSGRGKKARQYFIECEKKLVSVQQPMSQIDVIIQSAQLLKEQNERLDSHDEKIKVLEAKQVVSPDYFTIAGYGSLIGISTDLKLASKFGKAATKICKENGFVTGTIPDPRFGRVKTYPTEVLKMVFESSSKFGPG